jgi:hypothetical protein
MNKRPYDSAIKEEAEIKVIDITDEEDDSLEESSIIPYVIVVAITIFAITILIYTH